MNKVFGPEALSRLDEAVTLAWHRVSEHYGGRPPESLKPRLRQKVILLACTGRAISPKAIAKRATRELRKGAVI
jgi:hypothetical protein